jgi:hypothetical protein
MMDLQEIFRLHFGDYAQKHRPSREQQKAIRAIMNCRTAALGAHVDVCTECGVVEISYNSCNNRHCNKCQTMQKERWLAARREELINVGYFHTVFTIPAELNSLIYHNKKILRKSSDKFLLPVKAMRHMFRGKFLYYLKKIYADLRFYSDEAYLSNPACFDDFLCKLYKKEWVVYSKAPFKTAGHLLDYLGRYTHRVAISNNRILSCENGKVSFKWRDRRDSNKEKVMTLDAVELIRRVLMHVLPDHFMKIRHYGFLCNAKKSQKLRLVQKLTNSPMLPFIRQKMTARDIMLAATGRDICRCQHCGGLKQTIHSRASPSPPNIIHALLSLA